MADESDVEFQNDGISIEYAGFMNQHHERALAALQTLPDAPRDVDGGPATIVLEEITACLLDDVAWFEAWQQKFVAALTHTLEDYVVTEEENVGLSRELWEAFDEY